MGPFRRVEDDRAGPAALGILVPPGRRTFLILRPRALPFDLLVVDGPAEHIFRDFDREQAGRAAEALFDALQEWSRVGPGRVVTSARTAANGNGPGCYTVRAQLPPFSLIACPRRPGQPYAPLLLPDADAARVAAARLAELLCPPLGSEQEVYFNSRHFQR